jgi:hypothetical protein
MPTGYLLHPSQISGIVNSRKFLPVHCALAGNTNIAILRLPSNEGFHAAVFYAVGNNNKLNSMSTTQPDFSQIVGSSLGENRGVAVKVSDTSIMLFAMILKSQSELSTVAIQFTTFVTTR